MQLRRPLLATAAALLFLCAAGLTGYTQGRRGGRAAWEYKAVTLPSLHPEEGRLNELGAQGWELSGVTEVGGSTYYFFKRPK